MRVNKDIDQVLKLTFLTQAGPHSFLETELVRTEEDMRLCFLAAKEAISGGSGWRSIEGFLDIAESHRVRRDRILQAIRAKTRVCKEKQ